jgi:hypothetical protein
MKSEFELIDAFARRIRRAGAQPRGVIVGVGDDAAVLRPAPREDLVVTTDSLVEGVHFERRWLYGVNLGRRLGRRQSEHIAPWAPSRASPWSRLPSRAALPGASWKTSSAAR